jgi:hypothetical protein
MLSGQNMPFWKNRKRGNDIERFGQNCIRRMAPVIGKISPHIIGRFSNYAESCAWYYWVGCRMGDPRSRPKFQYVQYGRLAPQSETKRRIKIFPITLFIILKNGKTINSISNCNTFIFNENDAKKLQAMVDTLKKNTTNCLNHRLTIIIAE